MLYDDDDELEHPALSGAHQMERADHRSTERRELRKRKERVNIVSATGRLLAMLKNLVSKAFVKEDTLDRTFKTMTHKEEEEQRTQKADRKPSPEQLLTDAAMQEQAEDAAQYEEESSASG